MKILVFTMLIFCSTALPAQTDYLSIRLEGLSVHLESQSDTSAYYPRKLDSQGNFVVTPGVAFVYDKAVTGHSFSHIRFAGSYMSDCIEMPAVFLGVGAVFPLIEHENYSVIGSIGAGWYARKEWSYRIKDHRDSFMTRTKPIEWVFMPYPEIEFRMHPWDLPVSIQFDLMSFIVVSQITAGVQFNI